MVDVSARIEEQATVAAVRRRDAKAIPASVSVLEGDEGLEAYRRFAADAVFAPPQSPEWVDAWEAEARPDLIFVTVGIGAMSAAALALEVIRLGPFRVARFISGSHANGNFAPVSPAAGRLRRSDIEAVFAAVRAARPDVDLVAMERMLVEHAGVANPFAAMASGASPNVSLAVDLEGGFEALLKRSSGKRKRKKHRSQIRKFEAAGGYQMLEARTPAEIDRVLDAFFEMKHVRLTKMGVEDVFAPMDVQAFFRRLFKHAASQERPAFTLHALEVGGIIRAVTGSSRTEDRIICEFGAIIEDELAHASPGDFMFFEQIGNACAEGLPYYDFSVGDELYKRLWCDVETTHLDLFVPLTLKGRMLAMAERARTRLTAFVKGNAIVWAALKKLRRRAPLQPAEATDIDD
ncbi:MAG: GNAT family N-acetyltransferase [Rhizobiaceae bacterium]